MFCNFSCTLFLLLSAALPLFSIDESFKIEKKVEQEVQESFSFEMENIMGDLTFEENESRKIEASFEIVSGTKELLDKVQLKIESAPTGMKIVSEYPLTEHSLFYFPVQIEAKKKSVNRIRFKWHEKDVTLFCDKTPAASELVVNGHIKIPKGATIKIKNLFGSCVMKKILSEVSFETQNSSFSCSDCQGKLTIVNPSGVNQIDNFTGEMALQGSHAPCVVNGGALSAQIHLSDGDVVCTKATLTESDIVSGSGSLAFIECKGNFKAVTGSGKIHLEDCVGDKEMSFISGSGAIRCKGNFSKLTSLFLESGSGNIAFSSFPFPLLSFDVMSPIGGIACDLEGLSCKGETVKHFDVLSKEGQTQGKATIRSGSGSINLASSKKAAKVSKKKKEPVAQ